MQSYGGKAAFIRKEKNLSNLTKLDQSLRTDMEHNTSRFECNLGVVKIVAQNGAFFNVFFFLLRRILYSVNFIFILNMK